MLRPLINWLTYTETSTTLRVPRREEFEGALLLGDPGTGKTQIIHQMIAQVRLRTPAEAGVVFDPACEFLRAHLDPETDVVLNPLDARFRYWSPSLEVNSVIDRQLVGESFFPYQESMSETSRFFVEAARDIFELMLARRPTAVTIVEWLCDEEAIDGLVAGTEAAHKISKKAGPQRVAVLSTLARLGKLLRMLPPHQEGEPRFSLSKWAERRRGWIFITTTQDTREALKPLQAAFLNILMKRLLSADPTWGQDSPCWFVVDEVHALGRLSMLPTFVAESRKHGCKPIFGTQSKHQLRRHYGEEALMMLAAPHLKIFTRCNESEAAQWVSDNIGEEERERPRVGTTEGVRAGGRDSVNYSTFTERRAVVSKEQIMSLKNLHGYWKYSDAVVPFRIEKRAWPQVAEGFKPRRALPQTAATTSPAAVPPPPERPRPAPAAAPTPLSAAPPTHERPAATKAPSPVPPRPREVPVPALTPADDIDLNF
jgi:hypothetical protein